MPLVVKQREVMSNNAEHTGWLLMPNKFRGLEG